MKYLLDTNAWISYLNLSNSPIRERLSKHSSQEIATCSVVKAELYYGAYKSNRREKNLLLLSSLFDGIRSYAFDDAAAEFYGRIRAELARHGNPIGPNDFMISAIALANNLVLVTHNISEFGKVPGLNCDDWLA